jgi:FtsP/CotA-like multicopper oxidase with cupredoxin domain
MKYGNSAEGKRRNKSLLSSGNCVAPFQVCLGDRVIVDVTNTMPGKETALHWHGIFLKGQPYMDGVPMVTQCSIHEGETFRYDFYTNNAGTFFWHSHDGLSHTLRFVCV